jgi:hypothetical protein
MRFKRGGLLSKAWLWAGLYFLLIPGFAALYETQANGFYQTSATHEPSYLTNENDVQAALEAAITDAADSQALKDFGPSPSAASASTSGLYEERLTVDGTHLVDTVVLGTSVTREQLVEVQLKLPLDIATDPVSGDPKDEPIYYTLTTSGPVTPPTSRDDKLGLFIQYSKQSSPSFTFRTLHELNQYREFATAALGYVGGLPSQFPRMLYFSVVTVTTLGYGDITPVTSTTRFLVGSEAVLGVLLVGLFLNSLTRRVSQSRSLRKESSGDGGGRSGEPAVDDGLS